MKILATKRKTSVKGFTLVELIAVVAVILILVAIVVPRIGNLRDDANLAAKSSDVNILQGAFERAKVKGDVTQADAASYSTLVPVLLSKGYISKDPNLGLDAAHQITFGVSTNDWTQSNFQ